MFFFTLFMDYFIDNTILMSFFKRLFFLTIYFLSYAPLFIRQLKCNSDLMLDN